MIHLDCIAQVLDLCREWLRGFRPSRNRFSTRNGGAWIAKCINVMDRKDGPLPKFLLTPDKTNGNGRPRGHYVPLVTQRVRYKLQHSPLIDRYLANHSEKVGQHVVFDANVFEQIKSQEIPAHMALFELSVHSLVYRSRR